MSHTGGSRAHGDVLVATDLSPIAMLALAAGARQAKAFGVRLHVLHVGDEPDVVVRTESWVHDVMPDRDGRRLLGGLADERQDGVELGTGPHGSTS